MTDNEREQWNQVPAKIAPSDLGTYFTLSVAELDLVRQHRGQHNRLGFALQLLTLRYLGFCPEQIATTPVIVVAHVAQQLGVTPNALIAYGERAQTHTENFQ